MIDGIIKYDGTSRMITGKFPDTYEEFKQLAAGNGVPADVMFNSSGWQQLPTFLNKENLLADQTAALYHGLNADSTPNDVYAFLGGYTQWRWNRRTVKWTPDETAKTNVDLTGVFEWDATKTMKWAKEIEFSDAGEVQLKNPTIVRFTHDSLSALDVTKGNYVVGLENKVYRVDNSAVFSNDQYTYPSGDYYVKASNAYEITPSAMYGPWEEVRASTADAYPNSGIHDGYEYMALGMPLENSKNRIPVIGSYIGTGVYGEENKNHISLPGRPLCIWIFENQESFRMFISCGADSGEAYASSTTSGYTKNSYTFSNGGNDLHWYCNYGGSAGGGSSSNASAAGQLNESGKKYNYIAFYGGV